MQSNVLTAIIQLVFTNNVMGLFFSELMMHNFDQPNVLFKKTFQRHCYILYT